MPVTLDEAKHGVAHLKRKRRKCPVCGATGRLHYLTPRLFHRLNRPDDPGRREAILGPQLILACTAGCGYAETYPVDAT